MTQPVVQLRRRGFGETMRRDAWWLPPLGVFTILSSFLAYATWAAFQNANYEYGNYLSPFYSPLIFGPPPHAWLAHAPRWLAAISPALLILPFPAGFRFTCYYYRGAYYKAFWADPPSCAVGEPRNRYRGEHAFPLIVQNVHRYFLYVAVVFLALLLTDVWHALWFPDPGTGRLSFGIGVGTLALATNLVLLSGYTLGCHSLRHLVGGWINQLSRRPARASAYRCVTCLNGRHMLFAWLSLFSVALTDLYVRLCAMGVLTDWR